MIYFRTPENPPGDEDDAEKKDPSPRGDGSILKPMLHRIDPVSKRFVRLRPTDRQMYLPFARKMI